MNDNSFDALTKVLARSTSRRQTLKAMVTTLVGSLLGVSCTAIGSCIVQHGSDD